MLKKKELKAFAERLNEEKARLMNHSQEHQKEDLTLQKEEMADEVDLASEELNQNMTLKLRDRERLLIFKIEEALAKIEDGTFGICEGCEEPIEAKRLQARPVAELCIQCKEAQERDEKIYA